MSAEIRQRTDMILLPGWAFPAQVWAGVMPRLAEFAVPQSLDMPGINTSAPDIDPMLEHMARQLLTQAPVGAVWIGWSLGGLIAVQAALMAPERVTALVLVACTPKFVRSPDWPCATAPDVLDGFQHSLDEDQSGTLHRFAALCAHNGRRVETRVVRALSQAMEQSRKKNSILLSSGLDILKHADLRAGFRALICPVSCVLGEHDSLVPATVADALAALSPRVEITRIQGAGHAPFISHPAEFVGAVRKLCDRL